VLSTAAHAHLVINTPTPFNLFGEKPLVQVNPLRKDHPYPCQGLQSQKVITPIVAGGTQLVKFTAGAVHGSGSCAFSITYDWPPPKDRTRWKTIYSIIGGCPAQAKGNLNTANFPQNAEGRQNSLQCNNSTGIGCVRQFNIPIPYQLPAGDTTFA